MQQRLLLCTDMDRTVIANGSQPEHLNARQRFFNFCQQPDVTLVYVTGRHRALVQQAIRDYELPEPDYAITDVGSKIYHVTESHWEAWQAWEQEIAPDWQGYDSEQIKRIIGEIPHLSLQEASKQNTHKLSFYLPLHRNEKPVIEEVSTRLEQANIAASLIWSIDEPNNIGLLDVLPRHATKLHAIEFLQQQLGFSLNEVIFAGDSGNDLPVLGSVIPSVLVANASDEIKQIAQQLVNESGHPDSLYIAKGHYLKMNGNYTAGVLEGICHFYPYWHSSL